MTKQQIVLLLLLIVAALFTGCAVTARPPAIEQGILDLRHWDFERDGTASLVGEAAFYWEQLLMPADFAAEPQPTGFISIPAPWNGYPVQGRPLSGDGYATYRIILLLDVVDVPLALNVPEFETAYCLYVDGKLVAVNGIVGQTPETSQPDWAPQVVVFTPASSRVEIVLQISNFHHRKGGAGQKIVLGTEPQIRMQREMALNFVMALTGSLVIMALYHISLYTIRRKDPSALYFGLSCLLAAVRSVTTGEYYLIYLIPSLSWKWLVGLNYLSFALAIPVFAIFTRTLFPDEIPYWQIRVLEGVAGFFAWLILLTPPRIFTYGLIPYQIVTCIGFGFFLYFLALATRRRREGIDLFLLGFFAIFLTTLNDILYNNNLIQTGFIGPLGIFIFIFVQAFLLSRRYSKALTDVETLTQELETRVAARTAELALSNQQLWEANVDLQREIGERQRVEAALMQARDEAEKHAQAAEVANHAKSVFLANMSHELRTPLNVILGFSELTQVAPNLTPEQQENLASVRRNGEHLLAMLNRLLELSRMDMGQEPLLKDTLDLSSGEKDFITPSPPLAVAQPTWTLASLPASWRTEMLQATIEGDLLWMTELVKQIEDSQPTLAAHLMAFVLNFKHDVIRRMLETPP